VAVSLVLLELEHAPRDDGAVDRLLHALRPVLTASPDATVTLRVSVHLGAAAERILDARDEVLDV
jgi:2-keto-3-deoxy-L-rhamnonate aldolase RhmA